MLRQGRTTTNDDIQMTYTWGTGIPWLQIEIYRI